MALISYSTILLRALFPATLLAGSIIRFNVFSFVYFIFFLITPFLRQPVNFGTRIILQIYLICLITISCVFTLSHPALYLILAIKPPYDEILSNCSLIANISATFGIQRLNTKFSQALRLVAPDPAILMISVITLVSFARKKKTPHRESKSIKKNSHISSGLATEKNALIPLINDNDTTLETKIAATSMEASLTIKRIQNIKMLISDGKFFNAWAINTFCALYTVLLTGTAGIIVPSLLSSFYLLIFLSICTYWAFKQKVTDNELMFFRISLVVYSGLHLSLYYLYQFSLAQMVLRDTDFIARLLGLLYLIQSDCNKPGEVIFATDRPILVYFSPLATLLVYYSVANQIRPWLDDKLNENHFGWLLQQPSAASFLRNRAFFAQQKHTPARRMPESEIMGQMQNQSSNVQGQPISAENVNPFSISLSNYSLAHDSPATFHKISHSANPDDAQCQTDPFEASGSNQNPDASSDVLPRLTFVFGGNNNLYNPKALAERPLILSLHNSAIRNSYILTFIAMMAWSVTFRSWLSFILLVSACILWIVPNSRSACLFCSPIIVAYGTCIILLQYIYCFNLSQNELPTYIEHLSINLTEVGLHRWPTPLWPLAVQLGFLIFFWLNVRLFIMERTSTRLTFPHFKEDETASNPEGARSSSEVALGAAKWRQSTSSSLPALSIASKTQNTVEEDEKPTKSGEKPATSLSFPIIYEISRHSPISFRNLSSRDSDGPMLTIVDNVIYRKFTDFLHNFCIRYWIGLCCLTMLLLSLRRPVVIFRIGYMLHLVYFFTLFMVSYSLWRKQMLAFWWIIIGYSMLVLLCTYTYQFTSFPHYWQNGTGLSPQILKAIGLEQFDSAELFDRMMMPVAFLVVIILQVHYFHSAFLQISSLNRYRNSVAINGSSSNHHPSEHRQAPSDHSFEAASNFIEDVHSAVNLLIDKIYRLWCHSITVLWRIAEVYWIKLVCALIIMSVIEEVTITNMIPVLAVVLFFPFPFLHGFLVTGVFIFTGLQISMKMVFQLDIVSEAVYYNESYGNVLKNPSQPKYSITALLPNGAGQWIGLDVVQDFPRYITPLALLLVSCVLWHVITLHQRQFYRKPNTVRPKPGIIFPEMNFSKIDERVVNFLKCVANYTFYKLGLEICFCVSVTVACIRVDAFSVVYLLLMFAFLFSPRRICTQLWPAYLICLGVLIILQYAACIGIPSAIRTALPWYSSDIETIRLQQWLGWPSSSHPPDPRKLSIDFLQYLFVAMQWRVFKLELRPDACEYGGGDNYPVLENSLPRADDRDFISTKESYLDYLRHGIFYWSYWFSLAIVFATGISWITLFCLGYMILSFIYLWMGQNVMTRKRSNLLASWNVIIGYTFCVILAKCSLQLMGCVYFSKLNTGRICWLLQLFGVSCMNPVGWNSFDIFVTDVKCETVSNGLHWDVMCFIVILFQRKIFTTDSFRHVVFDLNVQSQFASRGAFLINLKLMEVINEQAVKEKHNLERVQRKLDKIATRQKELGKNAANINEHYIMIRSGDYYLFEGDPEEEEQDADIGDYDRKRSYSRSLSSYSEESGIHRRRRSIDQMPTQRKHLQDAWPAIDKGLLNVLSYHTDPYTIAHYPKSKIDRREKRRRAVEYDRSGNGSSNEDLMGENIGSPTLSSSRPSYQCHRRLASYPETNIGSTKEVSRPEPAKEAIELQTISRRTRQLRPSHRSPLRQATSQIPSKYTVKEGVSIPQLTSRTSNRFWLKTHRRIASATTLTDFDIPLQKLPSSSSARPVGVPVVSDLSQNVSTASKEINKLKLNGDFVTISRPSVSFAQSPDKPFYCSEELDNGAIADADDEDDDDANPAKTATSGMNPIQLINQAIEHGARHTIRQYRDKMLAHQQQSVCGSVDPASCQKLNRVSNKIKTGDPSSIQSGSMKSPVRQGYKISQKLTRMSSIDDSDMLDGSDPLRKRPARGTAPILNPQISTHNAEIKSGSGEFTAVTPSRVRPSEERVEDIHLSSHVSTPEKDRCWSRFKAGCLICYMFICSSVNTTIRLLNGVTREHRRVRQTIELEKRAVKRTVLAVVQQSPEDTRVDLQSIVLDVITGNSDDVGASPLRQSKLVTNRTSSENFGVPSNAEEHKRGREFRRSRSNIFLLFIAVGNLIVVNSEFVCYVILVLNHMRSDNVFSLVYPLMVFLWAMLSVPRPTKTFWITLITYTEVVIIVKYIFQFRFIEFNNPSEISTSASRTYWLPRIFGVEKNSTYAIWDLIQLLFIFLHRSYLKNHGLWRDDTEFSQDLDRVNVANLALLRKSVNMNNNADATSGDLYIGYTNSQPSRFNPIVKLSRFYSKMTDPRYNRKVDVYVYMFVCEFLAFWIIIFGYQSFGPSTGMGDNAFEFIKTNRIPAPFIGMIIIQSVFIITDRALFLRKQVLGKFIFQIIHVVLIHIWLFFVLPQITLTPFKSGIARPLLYMVKCVYFGLSSYQIRSGYPQHILGNFLTKNYNYINLVLFKTYLIMPFLYEVRSVMDWMWTDSPLSLYHWMELEDIYAKVFVMKCWRRSELEYPTPLGQKRNIVTKYTVGMLLLAFAFLCFWGPLAIGSFIDTTFAINVPVECSQALSIGGFPDIFSFTSRENSLLSVSPSFLSDIRRCNALDQRTAGFIDNFKSEDMSNMTFDGISDRIWDISPPMYEKLIAKLNETYSPMTMSFRVQCRRSQKEVVASSRYVEQYFYRPLTPVERWGFLHILRENKFKSDVNLSVQLNQAFPRFLLAQKDNLRNASGNLAKEYSYVNISASLHNDNISNNRWWVLQEVGIADYPCYGTIDNLTESDMNYRSPARSLSIITFNERVSDNLLGKIFSSYGIIGMYAAYIFVASRLLRMIYNDISYIISLQELPHVDRLLNLCHDIYLVRENGQLHLEEQLFAKLIFLYRSSETMIKWTRHPKHIVDRFTDKTDDETQPPPTQPKNFPSASASSGHHSLQTVSPNGSTRRSVTGTDEQIDDRAYNNVCRRRNSSPNNDGQGANASNVPIPLHFSDGSTCRRKTVRDTNIQTGVSCPKLESSTPLFTSGTSKKTRSPSDSSRFGASLRRSTKPQKKRGISPRLNSTQKPLLQRPGIPEEL